MPGKERKPSRVQRPRSKSPSRSSRMVSPKTDTPMVVVHAQRPTRFRANLTWFLGMAAFTFLAVVVFFKSAPTISGHECDNVSAASIIVKPLPKFVGGTGNVVAATKEVWHCAEAYRKDHPMFVLAAFAVVYITLQTFAIPGPIVLSILSGALYPPLQAQLLVSFCATTGASLCFCISYFLGKDIMEGLVPKMLNTFREKIKANKGNLFYYLLFLRITPLLPNWFVNLACPIVEVPFSKFFIATFLGLAPANYFHMSTGRALSSLKSLSFRDNASTFVLLFCLQFVALLPTLFKTRLARYENQRFQVQKQRE